MQEGSRNILKLSEIFHRYVTEVDVIVNDLHREIRPTCKIVIGIMFNTNRFVSKLYNTDLSSCGNVCITLNRKMAVFWVVAPCSLVEAYQSPC
jgi:hypothetical protein